MNIFKMKGIRVSIFAVCIAAFAMAALGQNSDRRRPQLPPGCENIAAAANERLAFKLYAEGVQVYTWNGTAWTLVAPIADLYAAPWLRLKVGIHYAGPNWESSTGSLVRGANPVRCDPDPNSISWLRLDVSSASRLGLFGGVTRIQRLNTSGGKAPAQPGSIVGEEVRIPYTTEYYFYRAED